MKQIVSFIVLVILFFGGAAFPVHAEVFINEFSSGTTNDWVELYNASDAEEALSAYLLRDNSTANKLELNGILAPRGIIVFEWGDRLNNPGDKVRLLRVSDDEVVDEVMYGNLEGSSIEAPQSQQSAGRITDGGSTWVVFSSPTKGTSNVNATPVPTSTPTPTDTPKPTPTPTKVPTPTRIPTPTDPPAVTLLPSMTSGAQVLNARTTRPTPIPDFNVPTAILAKRQTRQLQKKDPSQVTPEVKTLGVRKQNPSLLFIGVGLLLLLGCGGYAFTLYKRGQL